MRRLAGVGALAILTANLALAQEVSSPPNRALEVRGRFAMPPERLRSVSVNLQDTLVLPEPMPLGMIEALFRTSMYEEASGWAILYSPAFGIFTLVNTERGEKSDVEFVPLEIAEVMIADPTLAQLPSFDQLFMWGPKLQKILTKFKSSELSEIVLRIRSDFKKTEQYRKTLARRFLAPAVNYAEFNTGECLSALADYFRSLGPDSLGAVPAEIRPSLEYANVFFGKDDFLVLFADNMTARFIVLVEGKKELTGGCKFIKARSFSMLL